MEINFNREGMLSKGCCPAGPVFTQGYLSRESAFLAMDQEL